MVALAAICGNKDNGWKIRIGWGGQGLERGLPCMQKVLNTCLYAKGTKQLLYIVGIQHFCDSCLDIFAIYGRYSTHACSVF